MNKRGAVELSMTTIIIIIIGITILSLGLFWIRSTFTKVGELTASAFEQGETEIAEIFGSSKEDVALSPREVSLEQGGTETVTLAIRNGAEESISGVYASVKAIAFGGDEAEDLVCGFSDTLRDETQKYDFGSGQSRSVGLIVKDTGSSLGTYSCVITIYNLSTGEETISLIINLE